MKRVRQTRIEWALLGIIAAVCVVLSFLQYRWTGELSKAEPALLRASLNEQLRRFSRDFDGEIRESCITLVPTAEELASGSDAVRKRYEQWALSHDRQLFLRIAVASSSNQGMALYAIDPAGNINRIDWPPDWASQRDAMQTRLKGAGRPPNPAPDSNLMEVPIFGDSGSEAGWTIFELNEDYVRSRVLPRLVTEYLNPVETNYDVSVANGGDSGVIFSTRGDHQSVASNADATASLLPVDIGASGGRGHGRGRGHDQGRGERWMIAVRHHAGSLENAVAAVRRKNLLASLILIGLLGGTAWTLVQYTARSRRLAEMQLQFAAGVSHDLRTPLTAIRGAAFNLVEGVVKEPAAVMRYLRLILRNADELTGMIENVLAFSATLRSSKDHRLEAVALGDVLRHALDVMTPEIEQAGCRIEMNIAGELPAVAADPVAVELVFRNLLGNAARHGVGGKWIGVSATPCGEAVEVRVCDHGPGIPDGEKDRIFEPFYRSEQTRTQRIPGTGLGLSLVKRTVEQYRGTIEVTNSPGGGAEFTVRLPVFQPTA